MTQEQLDEILQKPIEEQIKALSVTSFSVPKWEDLNKQYDPNEHAIIKDTAKYPPIINDETGKDDMPRITRALQKLAVSRVAQAEFVTPAERIYNFDRESESQKEAIKIIEELYRTQNNIDAENLERAKKVNASCQVATVWRVYKEPNIIGENQSEYKLAHMSYSEMDGYKMYPNTDNNKNLIVISFEYKDSSDIEYFDIYVGGKTPQFISYRKGENGWELTPLEKNPLPLTVFPVVYTHLKEPVWGGDSGTKQVETIEETWSYRAFYIKKNSSPVFVQDVGDTSGKTPSTTKEDDTDSKRIIKVGKGGSVEAIVWDNNNAITKDQIKDMEASFFDDNQIANIAFSVLINSQTSADNKDVILTDAKAKAVDLGGEWIKLFNDELNKIIIPFAKVMFPSLANEFDAISVRSIVKPYSIKTDKENAEFVATAGTAMSLETQVKKLGQVTDIDAEVEAIENENSAAANQAI
jgi:hypothetical protein